MPGRLDREPERRAVKLEEFVTCCTAQAKHRLSQATRAENTGCRLAENHPMNRLQTVARQLYSRIAYSGSFHLQREVSSVTHPRTTHRQPCVADFLEETDTFFPKLLITYP